jgi:hypothetical protein
MVPVWVLFWVTAGALLPVVGAKLLVSLPAVLDRLGSGWDRVRCRVTGRSARAQSPPVERLAADLHRLAVHLDTVEHSREMHRVARLRAATMAYDAVLLTACRTLEIDGPDSTPLESVERLQTEAALAQRGLVW